MIDQPVQLPDAQPVLRLMPQPKDENLFGDIFGGWVMGHVDVAGGITAMRRSRGPVVTVAVNAFQFNQPISTGDVVSFYAEILKVGRTSVTVKVEVYAERHPQNPITVKVTEATLTYVAMGTDGKKRDVPPENA